MTPESYCNHLVQQIEMGRKKRVRHAPNAGFFRVYWLRPRKEVGPFPTIERAWLAPENYYRAQERFDTAQATYNGAYA